MSNFRICHYEDNPTTVNEVKSNIKAINREFKDHNVKVEYASILSYAEFTGHIMDSYDQYDMFIVDMYEKKAGEKGERDEIVGSRILDLLNKQDTVKPVVIYSHGTIPGIEYDEKELKRRYSFIHSYVSKTQNYNDLFDSIRSIVFKHIDIEEIFSYDEADPLIRSAIEYIGMSNLRELIFKFKLEKDIKGEIGIRPFLKGFSGAVLLALAYENRTGIMKISKDKAKLKDEHKRSQFDFEHFPFQVPIDRFPFENHEIYGILQFDVINNQPLFKWLRGLNAEEGRVKEIDRLLGSLFLEDAMNNLYKRFRSKKKYRFDYIFEKFNYMKISLIMSAVDGLKPILDVCSGFKFNKQPILDFLLDKHYLSLRKEHLGKEKYEKPLVLCHGDFHARNVLVQSNRPVIIDAGAVGYDYWCMDICRLIVNLFMEGIDYKTAKFFDLNDMEEKVKLGKYIINLAQMPDTQGNDAFTYAINWLMRNIAAIYGDLFSKFEFQLGLMKELLQLSYRSESVPPNKKVIALLLAQECLMTAVQTAEQKRTGIED